jgi:hypothetical protein
MNINDLAALIKRYCKKNQINIRPIDSVLIQGIDSTIKRFDFNKIAVIIDMIGKNYYGTDTISYAKWLIFNNNNNFKYVSINDLIKSERTYKINELLKIK